MAASKENGRTFFTSGRAWIDLTARLAPRDEPAETGFKSEVDVIDAFARGKRAERLIKSLGLPSVRTQKTKA